MNILLGLLAGTLIGVVVGAAAACWKVSHPDA